MKCCNSKGNVIFGINLILLLTFNILYLDCPCVFFVRHSHGQVVRRPQPQPWRMPGHAGPSPTPPSPVLAVRLRSSATAAACTLRVLVVGKNSAGSARRIGALIAWVGIGSHKKCHWSWSFCVCVVISTMYCVICDGFFSYFLRALYNERTYLNRWGGRARDWFVFISSVYLCTAGDKISSETMRGTREFGMKYESMMPEIIYRKEKK